MQATHARPSMWVLSVSRVGGAAQTKAMKKANASLRIQAGTVQGYESFARFSSDLDLRRPAASWITARLW